MPATFTGFDLDGLLSLAVSCEAGELGPGRTWKRRCQSLMAALWEGIVADRQAAYETGFHGGPV